VIIVLCKYENFYEVKQQQKKNLFYANFGKAFPSDRWTGIPEAYGNIVMENKNNLD
jgi:hypothetical protein